MLPKSSSDNSLKAQVGRLIAHIVVIGESALDEITLDVLSNALSDILLQAILLPLTEMPDEDGVSALCNSKERAQNGGEEGGRGSSECQRIPSRRNVMPIPPATEHRATPRSWGQL